ncbi:hypothetical protein DPMN_155580 [Dreissena polymorpha]|uniref:Uncharacterized protein n=1 Tax=Dreissena polymorpha TaxID=45954 RepID=A0A9D4JB18_DREPO|nr:hypothetical protein DPMN_155580 [Dreissena polymorpha]
MERDKMGNRRLNETLIVSKVFNLAWDVSLTIYHGTMEQGRNANRRQTFIRNSRRRLLLTRKWVKAQTYTSIFARGMCAC